MTNGFPPESVQRVLIHRLGSLGDTLVALPALHLIARTYPQAERRLLTNIPVHSKAPAAAAILADSGLIQGYMSYPVGERNAAALADLRRQIREYRPDLLVSLIAQRKLISNVRDYLFFRSCGIQRIVGIPLSAGLRENRLDAKTGIYEPEASRLARMIAPLGDAELGSPASWDMELTPVERNKAVLLLEPLAGRPFFACCVGTKVQSKDWGIHNWKTLLNHLCDDFPDHSIVMIGAAEEQKISDFASASWIGRSLNLCGALTPRESAAAMSHAEIFIGHDSGPMHLAAAVQVPCVAIFAARNKPAVWFPYGEGHEVLYHKTDCWGCGLETCIQQQKKCIVSITVDEVMAAIHRAVRTAQARRAL